MRWTRALTVLAVSIAGFIGLNCSSDSNEPDPVATTLALVSGNAQTGTVGVAVANPIMVLVTDQDGAAMAGVAVAFAVTGGGGNLGAATVSTNASGQASTTWTLGPTAGTNNNTATASVTGLTGSPVGFTASANAGAPSQLTKTAGDVQTGEVVQAVAVSPKVTVKDALNNAVAGVTVTWTVTAGGGSTGAATSMTDAAGEASISWTLGALVGAGLQGLQASIPGGINAAFTATGVLTAGTLTLHGGDNQSAVVNTAVDVLPSVLVKSPGGAGVPVAGVIVNWAVTAGGGATNTNASQTFADGVASVGWMVGGTVGVNNQGLSATVVGLTGSPVNFVASATAPPTQIAMFSGDGQTGIAGQPLPAPLVVILRDASNAPVPGVTVSWLAEDGGGSLSGGTSTTDAAGHAAITLTVGTIAGSNNQTVTCTSSGLVGSPVIFTASVVASAASQIAKSSGDAQTGTVNTALAQPIAVVVKDTYGNVKSGVTVNWAATAGSGNTAVASSVSDAAGIASSGWTIGTVAGAAQGATATAAGLAGSPLTFTAAATAGPAAAVAVVSGDAQSAMVGTPLATQLVASVRDAFNNPVAGAIVNWAADVGGGFVSAPTVVSSATGTVGVIRTLGAVVGAQTTTASVAGAPPITATFNATGSALVSNYSITLRYLTAVTPAQEAVFNAAAARWAGIIIGDVADITAAGIPAGQCGANSPAINEVIDDVLIFVTLEPIDGPGAVLGSAGPCFIRTVGGVPTKLSVVGRMRFDTDDIPFMETQGIFQAVMTHEMGHVIGIGSLWRQAPSLVVGAVANGGTDPYFVGTSALFQFALNGGGTYLGLPVPVEATGGAGTQDSHWRETIMGKELMTGYVSLVNNPLSAITIGSLTDIGYTISYANADLYTVDGVNLRVPGGAGEFHLVEAVPDWTLKGIDTQGRITRVR